MYAKAREASKEIENEQDANAKQTRNGGGYRGYISLHMQGR